MEHNEKLTSILPAYLGHVLLVSPLTFSYHISISETLRSMGYTVTWWDERACGATWYKLALRLFPAITARCSEGVFLKRLRKIDPASISHVLVIKGEGMSQRVACKLRETFISASFGFYLWDGIENAKGVFNLLPFFDSVATFDPVDAKKFGWNYRPLFGRSIPVNQDTPTQSKYDWCFIGTIHSDRHRVIHRLRQRKAKWLRSYVFGYFQSPLLLFVRMLGDWTLWFAPKDSLSTKPMPAAEVAEIVASSRAVLDVEHPQQRGFTMRTIETLLAGKKLVTTNEFVLGSNLFDPSRVHVISRSNPEIPSWFLDERFIDIPESIREYYSCEGWASELLSLQDTAKNISTQSEPNK